MPVGPYDDFDECVADNQDKDDPAAFCAWLEQQTSAATSAPVVAIVPPRYRRPEGDPAP
jgi:hypothetical protein